MSLGSNDRARVEEFFKAIEKWRDAYSEPTFSHLSVKSNEGQQLLKGQVTFNVGPPRTLSSDFRTENVQAGHCLLSEIAETPEKFVAIIESGKIPLRGETLNFPPRTDGAHGAYFHAFHEAGLQNQNRFNVCGIVGAQNTAAGRDLHLDWEVRAAATPYDGIADLANEYVVGTPRWDAIAIELVAFNVAAFDLSSSISGEKARLGLRLSTRANPERAALAYRVLNQNRVVTRATIAGSRFAWDVMADHQQGWADIDVPKASVVHGIATYAGVAHHQGWALDPNAVQNPLRAAYETFDKGMVFINEVLEREARQGNARDLEAVVGWLVWMLGFGVANLGSTPRTQEAPDLLATSPDGHIAVIEVTVGLLGADRKMARLHERAQAIRASLSSSNNTHVRVLPIIVTAKSRAEVEPEIEQAERWGIHVVTKEAFANLLLRSLVFPNPRGLFDEIEGAVQRNRQRYATAAPATGPG